MRAWRHGRAPTAGPAGAHAQVHAAAGGGLTPRSVTVAAERRPDPIPAGNPKEKPPGEGGKREEPPKE